jgi:hypothetical protein
MDYRTQPTCVDCHEKPDRHWAKGKVWKQTNRCRVCFEVDRDNRPTRHSSRMMDDRSTQDLWDAGVLS